MSVFIDILKRYTPSLKEWHSVADWGYVVVAFVIISISATLNAAQYQQLDNYPFVFISEQETEADPVITDSIFNAAARGIISTSTAPNCAPASRLSRYTTRKSCRCCSRKTLCSRD